MKSVFKRVIVSILTWEAKLALARYRPRIVAITGSVGKTSTKDAIFSVLAEEYFVRKSEKSFNSEIGLPLTILGLKNAWSNPIEWVRNILEGLAIILLHASYPEWLVLEVGADRPGDIKQVASWLHPDIVVMTHIPSIPVHVEFFPTPEALAREKRYLAEGIKNDGTLILNADDEHISAIKHPYKGRAVTYGSGDADVMVIGQRILQKKNKPVGMSFKIKRGDREMVVSLNHVFGIQHVYPALAAITVGHVLGLEDEVIAEALGKHAPPPGRMRIIPGIKNTTIIDDTYNSSPVAAERALEALQMLKMCKRKIAVLGDMMELGVYSVHAHQEIGRLAKETVDVLLAVGIRAQAIADAARKAGMNPGSVQEFSSAREAGKALELMLEEGDAVLVKGSQSMRMERVVEEIMEHPEDKEQLLVRQDAYWRAKS